MVELYNGDCLEIMKNIPNNLTFFKFERNLIKNLN